MPASVSGPPYPSVAGHGPRGRVDDRLLARLAGRVVRVDGPREEFSVRMPFTGEELGRIPRCTAEDVAEALRRAREAQPAWGETSLGGRGRIFLHLHDLVLRRREELLDLIQLESGKARLHAFEEVADVAIVSRHYAVRARRYLRPRRRRGALPGLTRTVEYRRPVGVVGVIAPWNYPLSLVLTDSVPALLAGNAVVLKPDPRTSFTALRAAELLEESGLPAGLFQVVTGEGPELGPPLVRGVDHLSFTGSTSTGRIVARQAAERLIGCSLELGGKNPMIVFADAKLERAVEGAVRGCFASAGQLCLSIERIYVQRPVFEPFLERLAARTRSLRLGPGLDFGTDVGSLVSAEQLRKVQEHVADAVAKGARVVVGGRARPELGPFFYEPTVLTGVTEGMRLFEEETFGPVVAVYSFRTPAEAVERANRSRYGLNASVWTRDTRFGRRIACRLRAGTVNVNEPYAAAWASVAAPMGGFGDSGPGRRHGAEGILKYTGAQTVAVQRLLPLAPPRGVGADRYAAAFARLLAAVRRVPGLR